MFALNPSKIMKSQGHPHSSKGQRSHGFSWLDSQLAMASATLRHRHRQAAAGFVMDLANFRWDALAHVEDPRLRPAGDGKFF